MPALSPLSFSLYLTWKRVLRTRVFFFFLAGFILFLAFFWWQAGLAEARRFFLHLFPYVFLLLAQDIFREEIDSGSLENVVFLRLDFRRYLLTKNISLGLIASGIATLLFLPLFFASLFQSCFSWKPLLSFFLGLIVGFYYLSLAGWLGLRLRSGSNVLAVILLQIFLFLGFLVSMKSVASGRDVVDLVISGHPENIKEQLFLFLFVAIWPNALISRSYSSFIFLVEVLAILSLFLSMQARSLSRWELKRE